MAFKEQKRNDDSDSWFNFQAGKFKPKLSYPDSKMRVYNKPDAAKPTEIEVEESTASDSMIVRVIKAFKGEE